MGMAPSGPSPALGGQMPREAALMPGANQPTDFYMQQPHDASHQNTQPPVPQAVTTAYQNNNDAAKTTVPANAEDSDLIEKEWVEKAKAIVEKTRRDPFLQSQELNRFKSEYLQKRYGKNVGSGGQ